MAAADIPLPIPETTPPVTNMYFVMISPHNKRHAIRIRDPWCLNVLMFVELIV